MNWVVVLIVFNILILIIFLTLWLLRNEPYNDKDDWIA